MHGYYTDEVCTTLAALDPREAIKAIHFAYEQLRAVTENIDCEHFDNLPALYALSDCLQQAGHPGFPAGAVVPFRMEEG